jgi:hypothetical protein
MSFLDKNALLNVKNYLFREIRPEEKLKYGF